MSEHLHDQANRAAILIANGLPEDEARRQVGPPPRPPRAADFDIGMTDVQHAVRHYAATICRQDAYFGTPHVSHCPGEIGLYATPDVPTSLRGIAWQVQRRISSRRLLSLPRASC